MREVLVELREPGEETQTMCDLMQRASRSHRGFEAMEVVIGLSFFKIGIYE